MSCYVLLYIEVSVGMVGYVPQALLDTSDADIRLLTDNSHDWVSH